MNAAHFNSSLDMASSYYVATTTDARAFPRLQEPLEADICVVGGGCTGLSAALHAAQQGLSVVLLEGGQIGWGASGRNGGQIIPGLRKSPAQLISSFGEERGRGLFDLSLQARSLVLGLIERHSINCDLKLTGHLTAAAKPTDVRAMQEEVEFLHEKMGYPHVRFLDANATWAQVSADYFGGVVDELGGHLHPLNYTFGLARAAADAGVRIFEHSPATRVRNGYNGVRVSLTDAQVRARTCILAGDALLQEVGAGIASYIMPVANYLVATERLRKPNALIAHDLAVSDSRFVVNYFRMSADGRLLFGGGERYSATPPRDIRSFVRPNLESVFPQLRGCRLDYAWGGLVSVTRTRLPHIGRDGEILYAHGYSGLGALLSTLAGKLLAQEATGESQGFDLFTRAAPAPFPGGTRLRPLLHVLGMLWYAALDRVPWKVSLS